ncbi:MAG: MBL fold metallo-hydrolase [Deltaproteobacteria bacterium]|nr:MBL fold metallo-hydrolase [Deltaproteobacteria bacterium]
MTEKNHPEYTSDTEEQRAAEDPTSLSEPPHPGWQPLSKVANFTEEIFDHIHFLLSYEYSSNIYLLLGDYVTIVDPGNDYTAFLQLFSQGFDPRRIKKIVLTHGHRDHCMGTFELLRYPVINENPDLELILHKDCPEGLRALLKEVGCRFTEVQGGEILNLSGEDWEVIYTPGHTLDSISLYHSASRTAITGDAAIPYAEPEIDKKAGGQLAHYLFGVRALLRRDIAHILPGHGVPIANLGRTVIEQTYEGLLLQVLGAEPESKVPWISGAEALAKQGLLEEAVFCCNKALAFNPENVRAMKIKALCLTDLGRGEEAIQVLDEILARQRDDPHALTAKGHALLGMGRYEESLAYFDQALKLYPTLQEAQVYKGMALYLSGRVNEAMDLEAFRTEFASRFKEEMEKVRQEREKTEKT